MSVPPAHDTLETAPDPASHWTLAVADVGIEVAAPLTAALDRVQTLTMTGRIDRSSLRALREEIEQARHAGMMAQQLVRLASGRLRQSHERLALPEALRDLLAQRAREAEARGIVLQPVAQPAEVIADGSMLFSLLNTLLDWALAQADLQSLIELAIDAPPWPEPVRLRCSFSHLAIPPSDRAAPGMAPASRPETLTWRLLEQTAATMGLRPQRREDDGRLTWAVDFPRPANDAVEGLRTREVDDGAVVSQAKPLAGRHVLVAVSRREVRIEIREALRHMGLLVDFVASVDEAEAFCRDGLPHALVIESALAGERFQVLREEALAKAPDFVVVEVVEEGSTFQMADFSHSKMARVGRDVLAQALPSALIFELSKGL